MKLSDALYFTNRRDWRAWLRKHHRIEDAAWLIYYKKHTGKPRIPYDDAVEEALCFGWIDSIVKRIDDERFAQKFTPRRNSKKWSPSNIRRLRGLIENGRMTEAGLEKIDPSVLKEKPQSKQSKHTKGRLTVPRFMKEALAGNPKAWENFKNLATSYRRQYVDWIGVAKREETRQKRLREAIALLERGRKLGMK